MENKNKIITSQLSLLIEFCLENSIEFHLHHFPVGKYTTETTHFQVRFDLPNYKSEVNVNTVEEIQKLLEISNQFSK